MAPPLSPLNGSSGMVHPAIRAVASRLTTPLLVELVGQASSFIRSGATADLRVLLRGQGLPVDSAVVRQLALAASFVEEPLEPDCVLEIELRLEIEGILDGSVSTISSLPENATKVRLEQRQELLVQQLRGFTPGDPEYLSDLLDAALILQRRLQAAERETLLQQEPSGTVVSVSLREMYRRAVERRRRAVRRIPRDPTAPVTTPAPVTIAVVPVPLGHPWSVGQRIDSLVNHPDPNLGISLRPHQWEILGLVDADWVSGGGKIRRAVCVAPTGSGKTRVMAASIVMGMHTGRIDFSGGDKVVILTHRETIQTQNVEAMRAFLGEPFQRLYGRPVRVTEIGGGVADYSGDILVVSVPTIGREDAIDRFRRELLGRLGGGGRVGLLLLDEYHRGQAETWTRARSVLAKMGGGQGIYELGFTATLPPEERVSANILFEMTPLEAMRRGITPPITLVEVRSSTSLEQIRVSRKGEFVQADLAMTVRNLDRDWLVWSSHEAHGLRVGDGPAPTLTFAVDLAHASELARSYQIYYATSGRPDSTDETGTRRESLGVRNIAVIENLQDVSELRGWLEAVRRKEKVSFPSYAVGGERAATPEGRYVLSGTRYEVPDGMVIVITGETPSDVRREVEEAGQEGLIECVVNVGVWVEGKDAWWVQNLMGTRPSLSSILIGQESGRSDRYGPDEVSPDGVLLKMIGRRKLMMVDPWSGTRPLQTYARAMGLSAAEMIGNQGRVIDLVTGGQGDPGFGSLSQEYQVDDAGRVTRTDRARPTLPLASEKIIGEREYTLIDPACLEGRNAQTVLLLREVLKGPFYRGSLSEMAFDLAVPEEELVGILNGLQSVDKRLARRIATLTYGERNRIAEPPEELTQMAITLRGHRLLRAFLGALSRDRSWSLGDIRSELVALFAENLELKDYWEKLALPAFENAYTPGRIREAANAVSGRTGVTVRAVQAVEDILRETLTPLGLREEPIEAMLATSRLASGPLQELFRELGRRRGAGETISVGEVDKALKVLSDRRRDLSRYLERVRQVLQNLFGDGERRPSHTFAHENGISDTAVQNMEEILVAGLKPLGLEAKRINDVRAAAYSAAEPLSGVWERLQKRKRDGATITVSDVSHELDELARTRADIGRYLEIVRVTLGNAFGDPERVPAATVASQLGVNIRTVLRAEEILRDILVPLGLEEVPIGNLRQASRFARPVLQSLWEEARLRRREGEEIGLLEVRQMLQGLCRRRGDLRRYLEILLSILENAYGVGERKASAVVARELGVRPLTVQEAEDRLREGLRPLKIEERPFVEWGALSRLSRLHLDRIWTELAGRKSSGVSVTLEDVKVALRKLAQERRDLSRYVELVLAVLHNVYESDERQSIHLFSEARGDVTFASVHRVEATLRVGLAPLGIPEKPVQSGYILGPTVEALLGPVWEGLSGRQRAGQPIGAEEVRAALTGLREDHREQVRTWNVLLSVFENMYGPVERKGSYPLAGDLDIGGETVGRIEGLLRDHLSPLGVRETPVSDYPAASALAREPVEALFRGIEQRAGGESIGMAEVIQALETLKESRPDLARYLDAVLLHCQACRDGVDLTLAEAAARGSISVGAARGVRRLLARSLSRLSITNPWS